MVLRLRRPSKGATFVHPLEPAPKTAILVPGFRPAKNVRVFPYGWTEEVKRFAPAVVAGTYAQLRALSRLNLELTHAVVVLSWNVDGTLNSVDRDLLWRAFGLPVFEQVLGPRNELAAYECEAHDGLHPVNAAEVDAVCGCGRALPLIARRRPVIVMPERVYERAIA